MYMRDKKGSGWILSVIKLSEGHGKGVGVYDRIQTGFYPPAPANHNKLLSYSLHKLISNHNKQCLTNYIYYKG